MNKMDQFLGRLKEKKKGLFLFDYDGTLSPLQIDRTRAFPYEGMNERLQKLHDHYRIVIISGRSLEDLQIFLQKLRPFPELWGSHGLEHLTLKGERKQAPIELSTLQALNEAQKICLKHVPSERCEKKPFGIAVHWRGMDENAKQQIQNTILPAWEKITQTSTTLHVSLFDNGLEIKPQNRNKGDVVKEILQDVPTDTPVVYFGDDLTDEDAFKALGKRGLKVLVRKEFRSTLADIHLVPPEELFQFLDQCIQI